MEEKRTYTYTKNSGRGRDVNRLVVICAAIFTVLIAVIVGTRLGSKKAEKEAASSSAAAAQEAARQQEEQTTVPDYPYDLGPYRVETGGYTLGLRETPARSAADLADLPDGAYVEILEVTEDPAAGSEEYRYWGRAEYGGVSGWLPMYYLAFSEVN